MEAVDIACGLLVLLVVALAMLQGGKVADDSEDEETPLMW